MIGNFFLCLHESAPKSVGETVTTYRAVSCVEGRELVRKGKSLSSSSPPPKKILLSFISMQCAWTFEVGAAGHHINFEENHRRAADRPITVTTAKKRKTTGKYPACLSGPLLSNPHFSVIFCPDSKNHTLNPFTRSSE